MADNRKRCAPISKETESTDIMREKLEKWRRMKGRRSACHDATTVYNRSKSAVTLDVNKNNKSVYGRSTSAVSLEKKSLKKRDAKSPQTNGQCKACKGYKRISKCPEDLSCVKKRRETFVIEQEKSPLGSNSPSPNVAAGGTKTHKDKSLSMGERLQLWRAEKRKSNPSKAADKSKLVVTKLKRKSGFKENVPQYQKLETDRSGFYTPGSTKPVSRVQTKSTIKKTRFVMPSNQKSSTVQPISVLKSKRKSTVNREAMTSNAIDGGKDTLQEDNAKLYKDKSLDMRERLELWLAERGKTPRYRTPALVKNARSLQQKNLHEKKRLSFDCGEENEDTDDGLFCAISPGDGENIEENLKECLLELEKCECDLEKMAAKLDLYNRSCPHTAQIANYWLCRAKIAQQQNDYDRVVCLFEQALVFKAQPESTIKDAVCDFVKFMKETGSNRDEVIDDSEAPVPESPVNESRADEKDLSLEEFNSSIIKFCLTEATPYRKKFKAAFGKPVLTPVRRSVRLELVSAQHPHVVQEHDLIVRRLEELPEDVQQNLFFKPNFAVSAQLNEDWNELQLDL